MNGVRIESAYYGDERSSVNITNSLTNRVSGGVLDVTADASLRPTFEAAPETTLDDGDIKKIEEQTVQACGGTADQACIERTRLTLSQQRLREKEKEVMSANVIKGERLTLNVIDAKGERRTLVTPGGQKLRVENVAGGPSSEVSGPTLTAFQNTAVGMITIALSAFLYALSVLIVWTQVNSGLVKFPLLIASIIFPYSGFLFVFVMWAFPGFFKEYAAK